MLTSLTLPILKAWAEGVGGVGQVGLHNPNLSILHKLRLYESNLDSPPVWALQPGL